MATYNDFTWKHVLAFLAVFLTFPTLNLWAGIYGLLG